MPEINNHINQNPIMANNQDISAGNINISNINNTDTDHNITINDNPNNETSLINNETTNTNSNTESSTNQNITIKIKNTLYHGIYTSSNSDCNNSKYSKFIALAKIKNIKNHCNLHNEHQNSEKNKKELDDKFTMLNDKFSFDGFYQVCDSTGKSFNLSNNNLPDEFNLPNDILARLLGL